MGEFVTDLDDSYTTEDFHRRTPRLRPGNHLCPVFCSRRATVSLPLCAQDGSADGPAEGDVRTSPAQTTVSFGFPVTAYRTNTPLTATPEERRPRNHFARKGSDRLKPSPERPKRRTRPATTATTSSQEVFHSITATPGLDDRSFEELRLECYNMSVAITGAVPSPVPESFSGMTQDGRCAEQVKVFPPLFAPFVSDPCSKEEGKGEIPDYIMSSDHGFHLHIARAGLLSEVGRYNPVMLLEE
ncbi:hypothetical protein C8T65DRAFT_747698 [Cerioporus squamosus]|nr:hypothetical protein C8T65DRAFT_747698 [Cerioporus squamosus]